MSDTTDIWLPTAKETAIAGESLRSTLYRIPLTILLTGELGAGKTTLLQGFARALGIEEPLTSPTYALEQRYKIGSGLGLGEFIHLDLYRLNEKQAAELVSSTDHHDGIRVIEWAERLPEYFQNEPHIFISLSVRQKPETRNQKPATNLRSPQKDVGRNFTVTFNDIPLPSRADIEGWRREVRLPAHIAAHCDAVAEVCDTCCANVRERGILVRPLALKRSAEAHDLLRFIDFRMRQNPEHYPSAYAEEEQQNAEFWNAWKECYEGQRHEAACAAFLRERGFSELGRIVAPHGLVIPTPERVTIEQKILFYADKRVMLDRFVTLDERFADFRVRYGKGQETEEAKQWYAETKEVERELFPEGAL